MGEPVLFGLDDVGQSHLGTKTAKTPAVTRHEPTMLRGARNTNIGGSRLVISHWHVKTNSC